MVGPPPDEQRQSAYRRFKVALVVMVGASGGLITIQGDAPLPVVGAAVVGGLVVGALLVWYVFPGTGELERRPRQ